MCALTLTARADGETKRTHVQGVYNPSPVSYLSINGSSTILEMGRSLNTEGDFNLHHPYWSGPSTSTWHAAADSLLELVEEKELSLTLIRGTVSWESRSNCSIIEIVFMSDSVAERLVHF